MDEKKWYTSKTVWASVFTTLMGIIALIDVNFGTNLTHQPWYGFVVSLAGTFGIYGRAVSNTTLVR